MTSGPVDQFVSDVRLLPHYDIHEIVDGHVWVSLCDGWVIAGHTFAELSAWGSLSPHWFHVDCGAPIEGFGGGVQVCCEHGSVYSLQPADYWNDRYVAARNATGVDRYAAYRWVWAVAFVIWQGERPAEYFRFVNWRSV